MVFDMIAEIGVCMSFDLFDQILPNHNHREMLDIGRHMRLVL